jgi:hypothetical protein
LAKLLLLPEKSNVRIETLAEVSWTIELVDAKLASSLAVLDPVEAVDRGVRSMPISLKVGKRRGGVHEAKQNAGPK